MKLKVFIIIICIQIGAIILIFLQINQNNSNTLGILVNTIDSTSIQKTKINGLNYFYEPKANSTQEIHENWLPYVPKYTINGDSLNERYNYQTEKPKDVYRIITLGDSFTYGLSVSTSDNWTEILEDELNIKCKSNKFNKIEVINLGVDGYDIPYEVERYRIRGIKYNPDMVIWMLFDPTRMKEYMTPIINECTRNLSYTNSKDYFKYKDCWAKSEDLLMKKFGESGIRSYLKNSLESIFKYFNRDIVILDFLNNHSQILKDIKKVKVFNNFRIAKYITYGDANNNYYLFDGHPNIDGHKAISEDIFLYLKKMNLIQCKN